MNPFAQLLGETGERHDLLRRIMGSPDPRQIDGIGGGHPLTSKVAVVSPAAANNVDGVTREAALALALQLELGPELGPGPG